MDLITVFETVWDWVCETVIETIIQYIKYVLYILVYVTRWICIAIHFVIGLIPYLLCLLGLSGKRKIRICIKVLTDNEGNTKIKEEYIEKSINSMRKIYSQCNIDVIIDGVEYIAKPEYLEGTNCSFGGLFSLWHAWFSERACSCCNQITVFFVDDISSENPGYDTVGCAYPGDNWCRVDKGSKDNSTIMAHEVGHLLMLPHNDDENNFMFGEDEAYGVTKNQCCIMRWSPFVTIN